MTTRTEPTITNTTVIQGNTQSVGLLQGFFGKGKQDHKTLLTDALQAFTEATGKLEAAELQINADIQDDLAEMEAISKRVGEQSESLSRLQRIKGKIEDLLA